MFSKSLQYFMNNTQDGGQTSIPMPFDNDNPEPPELERRRQGELSLYESWKMLREYVATTGLSEGDLTKDLVGKVSDLTSPVTFKPMPPLTFKTLAFVARLCAVMDRTGLLDKVEQPIEPTDLTSEQLTQQYLLNYMTWYYWTEQSDMKKAAGNEAEEKVKKDAEEKMCKEWAGKIYEEYKRRASMRVRRGLIGASEPTGASKQMVSFDRLFTDPYMMVKVTGRIAENLRGKLKEDSKSALSQLGREVFDMIVGLMRYDGVSIDSGEDDSSHSQADVKELIKGEEDWSFEFIGPRGMRFVHCTTGLLKEITLRDAIAACKREKGSQGTESTNEDSEDTESTNEGSQGTESTNEDSKDADNKTEDSEDTESKSEDSKDTESTNEDSEDTESTNEDSEDTESKSEDSEDTDSKNEDSKPADSKNEDSKDADSKSEDSKDADSKNEDSKPADSKNEDSKDADSKNEDSKDADSKQDSQETSHNWSPEVLLFQKRHEEGVIRPQIEDWKDRLNSLKEEGNNLGWEIMCATARLMLGDSANVTVETTKQKLEWTVVERDLIALAFWPDERYAQYGDGPVVALAAQTEGDKRPEMPNLLYLSRCSNLEMVKFKAQITSEASDDSQVGARASHIYYVYQTAWSLLRRLTSDAKEDQTKKNTDENTDDVTGYIHCLLEDFED